MSLQNIYAGLVGNKVIALTIPREDIESRNTEAALISLDSLIVSTQALEASNGAVSLMVSGYDDDLRELPLIPEVRTYFQTLDEQFPYWFHVCSRIDHSLRTMFTMLADLTPVALQEPPGAMGYQISNDDLNIFVDQRLIAMQSLHAKYGFSAKESERITNLVISYFSSLVDE